MFDFFEVFPGMNRKRIFSFVFVTSIIFFLFYYFFGRYPEESGIVYGLFLSVVFIVMAIKRLYAILSTIRIRRKIMFAYFNKKDNEAYVKWFNSLSLAKQRRVECIKKETICLMDDTEILNLHKDNVYFHDRRGEV